MGFIGQAVVVVIGVTVVFLMMVGFGGPPEGWNDRRTPSRWD